MSAEPHPTPRGSGLVALEKANTAGNARSTLQPAPPRASVTAARASQRTSERQKTRREMSIKQMRFRCVVHDNVFA